MASTRGTRRRPRTVCGHRGNAERLTERNLRVAREVDRVTDGLGATSAQVAVAWVRGRGERIVSVVGIRTVEQLHDVVGGLEVEMTTEALDRLDQISAIELGFPHDFLREPHGQLVYGDLEARIDLPRRAPRSALHRP